MAEGRCAARSPYDLRADDPPHVVGVHPHLEVQPAVTTATLPPSGPRRVVGVVGNALDRVLRRVLSEARQALGGLGGLSRDLLGHDLGLDVAVGVDGLRPPRPRRYTSASTSRRPRRRRQSRPRLDDTRRHRPRRRARRRQSSSGSSPPSPARWRPRAPRPRTHGLLVGLGLGHPQVPRARRPLNFCQSPVTLRDRGHGLLSRLRAPTPSQYCARSESTRMKLGSSLGW